MTTVQEIEEYMSGLAEAMSRVDRKSVESMVDTLMGAYESESTVYICGNGGSGATASHIVCDFNKGISLNLDRKFRFVCLNDNVATMLAISNDICYEDVFLVQAEGRVRPGDVLVAISGSGNSENVVRVADYFRSRGNTVVGLSGYSGGKLKGMSDVSVHVPVDDMQKVEDAHMSILHMCAQIIARRLGNPLC